MEFQQIGSEKAQDTSIQELFRELATERNGLSGEEAQKRLVSFGPNVLEEHKVNPILKFLGYFWGPIPWMIEIAATLSLIVRHWSDFIIIMVLLVFNAVVGFWQEHKAANALEALKNQLALKARVNRDKTWQEIDARDLVPGDVIRLRLGDIIPADVKLFDGDYLSVDQSALTGESLPVTKRQGDIAYSGSAAKQGEMVSLVVATGNHTYFGRTAELVETAGAASHFQKAVLQIGDYLIYLSLALISVLVVAQIVRHAPLLEMAQFALILAVASIPVAMPAVLSVTMAVGALALSKLKAIVSRLESIEEMAGIDILCSDKTGTLTQNKLTLGKPVIFEAKDTQELILAGALASKAEDRDAIDLAVIGGLTDAGVLDQYQQVKFVPFDPVSKRTEAVIKDSANKTFTVTKGAPQIIMDMSGLDPENRAKAEKIINDLAAGGYRTLGVARSDGKESWQFLGILPLFDPPREDSAETITNAKTHGITIKMVTGDNVAIGREISKTLGMGTNIQPADSLFQEGEEIEHLSLQAEAQIEQADGFAQVFPEHKFGIVKALQERGHLVGMTGDGVNDAPALKQADVGIAVSGATDAARAAAALVLTEPGLSVIIKAVEKARRIFERMTSYAIYRITETIRIMFFMVLAMLVYNVYPITAIMIILLALLNDLPIMTIAYDKTWLDPQPVKWKMHNVLTISSFLGGIGVVETFLLLAIAKSWFGIDQAHLQSIIFLKLAVAGHLTLFVARSRRKPFFAQPYPAPILLTAILCTQAVAVLIVAFGIFVTAIPWTYIGLVWLYCIAWIFIEDWVKLRVYRHLDMDTARHRNFLTTVKKAITHHAVHQSYVDQSKEK
ncbi:MAG: plasma-membrane proton-efflux P-type ATPase [Deltaproteobacteria bacterium]|nr:plasma-membrane proton-efflux P-type ATPase [Deltaproteobacteria bacterium]